MHHRSPHRASPSPRAAAAADAAHAVCKTVSAPSTLLVSQLVLSAWSMVGELTGSVKTKEDAWQSACDATADQPWIFDLTADTQEWPQQLALDTRQQPRNQLASVANTKVREQANCVLLEALVPASAPGVGPAKALSVPRIPRLYVFTFQQIAMGAALTVLDGVPSCCRLTMSASF